MPVNSSPQISSPHPVPVDCRFDYIAFSTSTSKSVNISVNLPSLSFKRVVIFACREVENFNIILGVETSGGRNILFVDSSVTSLSVYRLLEPLGSFRYVESQGPVILSLLSPSNSVSEFRFNSS